MGLENTDRLRTPIVSTYEIYNLIDLNRCRTMIFIVFRQKSKMSVCFLGFQHLVIDGINGKSHRGFVAEYLVPSPPARLLATLQVRGEENLLTRLNVSQTEMTRVKRPRQLIII